MNKIAAYELLIQSHPLWTKEARFALPAAGGILGGLAGYGIAPEDHKVLGAVSGGLLGAGTMGALGARAVRKSVESGPDVGRLRSELANRESAINSLESALEKAQDETEVLVRARDALKRVLSDSYDGAPIPMSSKQPHQLDLSVLAQKIMNDRQHSRLQSRAQLGREMRPFSDRELPSVFRNQVTEAEQSLSELAKKIKGS